MLAYTRDPLKGTGVKNGHNCYLWNRTPLDTCQENILYKSLLKTKTIDKLRIPQGPILPRWQDLRCYLKYKA